MKVRVARVLAVVLPTLALSVVGAPAHAGSTIGFETLCGVEGGQVIYETPADALPSEPMSEDRPGCDFGPSVDGFVGIDSWKFYGVCRGAGFDSFSAMWVPDSSTDTITMAHRIVYCVDVPV